MAASRLVRRAASPARPSAHSHSIVPDGLEIMQQKTRLMPGTSLILRVATRPGKSWGEIREWKARSLVDCVRRCTTKCNVGMATAGARDFQSP